ncbi:MAG: hypothetical protein HRT38_11085, partial [Alteromonadaceae bacterium]|nr:hypothetical protein [Alteromonadaceae bacterium]
TPLTLGWLPHFTSVINWTLRIGLGILKQVKPVDYAWVAILDHSIDIGIKKAFVVLRVAMDALAKKGKAIGLEDCECIGLKISEKVNGESIALELEEIFNQAGQPAAVIKDCDYTLGKGVRLYAQKQKITVPVIDDIGHVMATALKVQYKDSKGYKDFTELTSKGANRLRQTNLAYLIPPKLRKKGRFLSISKLGKWGGKMLKSFAVKGVAKKGSVLEKLRNALPGFNQLKPFIKSFANTAKVLSDVMETLKNNGLNQASHEKCFEFSKQLSRRSVVRKRLQSWLNQHITIQEKITGDSLLVSSDIIESLFGKFKHVIERSSYADINRTALLIPALCGNINETVIMQAFEQTSQKDLKDWEEDNIPYTMRKKRQAFFNGSTSQKPVNEKAA